jgi:GNAT superfamily N-acetyltransferase
MYLRRLDALPLPESLAGYTIRRFILGEERAWWHLLDDAGGLGTWDATRAEEAFADPSGRVWKESIHFAVAEDHLVGTACVQLNARRDDLAEMGWVAVVSAHRRRGLGRILCLHTLVVHAPAGLSALLRSDAATPRCGSKALSGPRIPALGRPARREPVGLPRGPSTPREG